MGDTSITANIQAGKYKNQVPYPLGVPKDKLSEARTQYRAGEDTAQELFKQDVLEAFGLTDHPKAGRAFEIAWSHGHSAGYYEVLLWFDELSELLK